MTEKRFSVIEGECDVYDENYHNIVCRTDFKEDAINVCKLLNELHEENQSFEIHSKWQGEKYSELLDSFTRMKKNYQLVKKENEQLKQNKFICLDCEYSGYTEIGCLCEKQDHWEGFRTECNNFKELQE